MSLDPEMSIKDPQIEEMDRKAKEILDGQRKSMGERVDAEYREHIQQLLEDLQKEFVVEDVNLFEAEEYCIVLKNKDTGQLKSYAFEAPLMVHLSPVNKNDPNNVAVRTAELYNYLFNITKTEK